MSEDELLLGEPAAPAPVGAPRVLRLSASSAKAKKERADDDVEEESDLSASETPRRSASHATPKGYPTAPPPPAAEGAATAVRSRGVAARGRQAVAAAAAGPPAGRSQGRQGHRCSARERPSSSRSRAETLVQRADRLFTEGRWVEAAVAYRDLLRQSPSSPDAPRWRRRLSAADAAAAATRTPPP